MAMAYLSALICVVALAAGQMLFKVGAAALASGSPSVSLQVVGPLIAAMALYAGTSIAWVWILRTMELGRIYPLTALAFVLVLLGSHLFFGERFHPQYWSGVALIVAGIALALKS